MAREQAKEIAVEGEVEVVTYENRDKIQVRDLDGLCAPWVEH